LSFVYNVYNFILIINYK